ncbi:MAG: hypothetical protein IJ019_01155 [Alphaproteobacteria bacterium]|nr:hypothetical protein [Alphaproteobacteria bacterium]
MSKLIFNIPDVALKIFLCVVLLLFFGVDYIEVSLINKAVLNVYVSMMFVSLLSLFLTIFPKVFKYAICVFLISFLIYIYMYNNIDEIVEQHNLVDCFEVGKVYDPNQKICQDNCWTWDEKLGCLKE